MLRLALAILLAPFFWGLLGLAGEQLIFLVSPEAADGTATPLGYLLMRWRSRWSTRSSRDSARPWWRVRARCD